MAGASLEIRIDTAQLRAGLSAMQRAGQTMRPMMVIAGAIFENSTRSRFDAERGPGNLPWPATKFRIAGAVGPSGPVKAGKILQDKGHLRGSIRSNVGDSFVETGVDGRNVSSAYAAIHQFGYDKSYPVKEHQRTVKKLFGVTLAEPVVQTVKAHNRHMKMPVRAFLGIDETDIADLKAAFVDYLEGEALDGGKPKISS